jgi:hypothetical protein
MSGGPDLNRRPLRPERVSDPATRCYVAYRAPTGVPWYLYCASYGGTMAAYLRVTDVRHDNYFRAAKRNGTRRHCVCTRFSRPVPHDLPSAS